MRLRTLEIFSCREVACVDVRNDCSVKDTDGHLSWSIWLLEISLLRTEASLRCGRKGVSCLAGDKRNIPQSRSPRGPKPTRAQRPLRPGPVALSSQGFHPHYPGTEPCGAACLGLMVRAALGCEWKQKYDRALPSSSLLSPSPPLPLCSATSSRELAHSAGACRSSVILLIP